MEEENKIGYCTITYKFRVYTNHTNFLKLTKDLYNEAILIYYNLLLDNLDFLNLSNQYCLRELEKLTIISREGKKPEKYIETELPTYFRRAAINQAIGAVRSYISWSSKENIKSEPSKTKKFNKSPLFYKGMYKNLTSKQVELKLWNGEKWDWYKANLKGRNIDFKEDILSPTLVLQKDFVMMHIPVKEKVEDARTVKQRMQDEDLRVCGISFSNSDNFAICVIISKTGEFIKSKFIKGGNEYKERTSKILNNIKKNRRVNSKLTEKDHKNYWDKLDKIDEDTAHKVSKEIIDFCLENKVKVISIAKIEEDVESFARKVGKHSPIYLKRKIVNFLEYKSFKNGIVITTVRQNYTASKCNICRGKVKKNNLEFICENGHRGNYFFNTSMNIGKMCLKKFGLII